jgi:Potential DNA-binding domain
MATFCFSHIMSNKDQRLFQLCTAKFSDNSQCNSPVFDISHELPLCREHAWKRDNYNRITLEQKPKKSPRKKLKSSAMTRPTKKNRKKKKVALLAKQQQQLVHQQQDQVIVCTIPPVSNLQPPQIIQKPAKAVQPVSKSENNFHSGFSNFISNRANNVNPETPQKEYLTLCENSSAYESSEDTGVGGLSETEFMAHDGDIGQIIGELVSI